MYENVKVVRLFVAVTYMSRIVWFVERGWTTQVRPLRIAGKAQPIFVPCVDWNTAYPDNRKLRNTFDFDMTSTEKNTWNKLSNARKVATMPACIPMYICQTFPNFINGWRASCGYRMRRLRRGEIVYVKASVYFAKKDFITESRHFSTSNMLWRTVPRLREVVLSVEGTLVSWVLACWGTLLSARHFDAGEENSPL